MTKNQDFSTGLNKLRRSKAVVASALVGAVFTLACARTEAHASGSRGPSKLPVFYISGCVTGEQSQKIEGTKDIGKKFDHKSECVPPSSAG